MHSQKNRRGFTLIELLLVISIIGLLSSVVLASVNAAREAARIAAAKQSDGSIYRANSLNLLGEWTFDEDTDCSGSVTSVLDTSGNELHLTTSGSPTFVNDTPYGNGCSINLDINSSAYLPNDSTLEKSTMSGFVWIKPDEQYVSNQWNIFLCRDIELGTGWSFCLDARYNTLKIRFTIGPDYNNNYTLQAPPNILDVEKWNFVGFSYDGERMTLYKDGIEVASMEVIGFIYPGNANAKFYVGYQHSSASFSGYVDLVRLYGKPLNASEMWDAYASTKGQIYALDSHE